MLLTSARITNYKSVLDSTEFTVGPLTCLVGRNESGKSAVLQALYGLNPVVRSDARFDPLDYPRMRYSELQELGEDDPSPIAIDTRWTLTTKDLAVVSGVLPGGKLHPEVTVSRDYAGHLRWGIAASGDARAAIERALTPRLPKFVLFSDYHRLPGQIAIDDLLLRLAEGALTAGDRTFMALLDLAGTRVEDLHQLTTSEPLIAALEAVSNRISREIFTYWSQNRHLRVQFRLDAARPGDPPPFNTGQIFRIRIENARHGVSVGFDERSAGFVWFFSFLVWFSQLRKQYAERLILLLDEPGLSLHARAQADLLRYINERLRPSNQVLYSTHSPFLIDTTNLAALRAVEDRGMDDGELTGTVVSEEIWSSEADTLLPIQAAISFDQDRPRSTIVVGPGPEGPGYHR